MTILGNGNVQSHDQKESKLNSTINATISKSKLVTKIMFNFMTKKEVNWTVQLTQTVVPIHLHMKK